MIFLIESGLSVAGNTAGGGGDLRKKIPAECGVFDSSRYVFESGLAPDFVTARESRLAVPDVLSIGRGHLRDKASEWRVGLLRKIAVQRADFL